MALLVCMSWCKVVWPLRDVILFVRREKWFKLGSTDKDTGTGIDMVT